MYTVLVLCTANSARSILGEAILNRVGAGRFRAYSAGSHPRGTPNPSAIALLDELGYPTVGLRSKSWDEFAAPGAPVFDLVITVCDDAAGEACPLWPGAPIKAHWGIPDPAGVAASGPASVAASGPASVAGGEAAERAAFRLAHDRLLARMTALVALPVETMTHDALRGHLRDIAKLDGATVAAQDGTRSLT